MDKTSLCCGDGAQIDLSKIEIPDLFVELFDQNVGLACTCIIIQPLVWNQVARHEYQTRQISSLFGSPHRAVVFMAVFIMLFGLIRDYRFKVAIATQSSWALLDNAAFHLLGYLVIFTGCVLVFTSFWALGFYNTFLGDYFGILMEKRVTGFPFNLTENPMYWGSTLNFCGTALLYSSPAGLFLSLLVLVVYKVSIFFEEPFTEMIYKNRSKKVCSIRYSGLEIEN